MAGIVKPFRIIRTMNFTELNLVKKIRNFFKPGLKFTVFKNRFKHEINKFPRPLKDQAVGRSIKNSWHIKNKVLSIRNNREHLKRLFFLKSKQYILSFFLRKLSKIKYSTLEKLVSHELSLPNILLRSGFAVSLQEIKKYVRLGLIFINFKVCTNSNCKLQEKDIIQVVVSKNFYSDYRYRLNSILSLNYKILKYKSDKLKVKKVFKQQAQSHTGG
jgi:ribosomal protein S4